VISSLLRKKKDSGVGGNAAGHRGNSVGRLKRKSLMGANSMA